MNKQLPMAENWNVILDALQAFDHAAAPVGLYAANEFRRPTAPEAPFRVEWELALAPALMAAGCNPLGIDTSRLKHGCFDLKRGDVVESVRLVRLSVIKVRKYGNGYRVDPHLDHTQRWKELAMESQIKAHSRYGRHALIFIGFTADKHPFAKELASLGNNRQPTAQRFWPDPHGRGFNTFTALWINV
jgi:hypothetical protein